jgi:hypothetical protein
MADIAEACSDDFVFQSKSLSQIILLALIYQKEKLEMECGCNLYLIIKVKGFLPDFGDSTFWRNYSRCHRLTE